MTAAFWAHTTTELLVLCRDCADTPHEDIDPVALEPAPPTGDDCDGCGHTTAA